MKILFKKNFSTTSFEIEVKQSDNGKDLRALLAHHEKVTSDEVQLKFWGDVIQDDYTVADYKMKEGDNIIYQIIKGTKKFKTEGGPEEATTKPNFITLTLKQEGEQDLQIETVPEDSIAILRVKIEGKHGIPSQAIRLKNKNNMIMFPAKRLIDYEIDSDATVEMIVDKNIVAAAQAKPAQDNNNQVMDQEPKGDVKVKVNFHDGEEKELTADYDDTIESLRQKLLELKPIDKAKESNHKLNIIAAGENRGDKAKLKDLGMKGNIVVATMLERVKGENELSLTVKRFTGAESTKVIIDKNATVADLKKQLEDKFKATSKEINLKYGGNELTDDKVLSESGVADDGIVTLSVFKANLFSNK